MSDQERRPPPLRPCAACRTLRRKCTTDCLFAPYFPPDNMQKFHKIHKVYGASNVSKLISEISPEQRAEFVDSLVHDAECRIRSPVYGCVGTVAFLQQQLRQVNLLLENAKKELANYIGPSATSPVFNQPGPMQQQQQTQNTGPSGNEQQLLIVDPNQLLQLQQQQQMLETLRIAAAAAAGEGDLLRASELQQLIQPRQNELSRFDDAGGYLTATGADQISADALYSHHFQQLDLQQRQLESLTTHHPLRSWQHAPGETSCHGLGIGPSQQGFTSDHHQQQQLAQQQASHSQQQAQGQGNQYGMGIGPSQQGFITSHLLQQLAQPEASHSQQNLRGQESEHGTGIGPSRPSFATHHQLLDQPEVSYSRQHTQAEKSDDDWAVGPSHID